MHHCPVFDLGAAGGNRTRIDCLEGSGPTVERQPRVSAGAVARCPLAHLALGRRAGAALQRPAVRIGFRTAVGTAIDRLPIGAATHAGHDLLPSVGVVVAGSGRPVDRLAWLSHR